MNPPWELDSPKGPEETTPSIGSTWKYRKVLRALSSESPVRLDSPMVFPWVSRYKTAKHVSTSMQPPHNTVRLPYDHSTSVLKLRFTPFGSNTIFWENLPAAIALRQKRVVIESLKRFALQTRCQRFSFGKSLASRALGPHPFPSRTRSLSQAAPMVLRSRDRGRVGRCRHLLKPPTLQSAGGFFVVCPACALARRWKSFGELVATTRAKHKA